MKREGAETQSEALFIAICEREGYSASKIPTDSAKTADFRISSPFGGLIAEVKELTPNKEERALIRAMDNGEIVAFGGTIGSRAKEQIGEACDQLRQHRHEGLPSLVVLYNNVTPAIPHLHLQWTDIDAAMYGQWVTYSVLTPEALRKPDYNGGKRALGPSRGTYVSAVAVISDLDQETFYLFHNAYAAVPLPKGMFTAMKCWHYRKPGGPHSTPTLWEAFSNSVA